MNQTLDSRVNGVDNARAVSSTVNLKDCVSTPGDTFLGFGHGKHPCPGRYFAAHEMKLLLAHVVQNYDVEHLATRPLQDAIMETKLPSQSTEIRVRRRKEWSGKV